MPTQPGAARDVTVSFRIRNERRNAALAPFRTRMTPGVFSASGVQSFDMETSTLGPGQTVAVSHTIENAPDAFEIRVEADPDGAVVESDEANNIASATFRTRC